VTAVRRLSYLAIFAALGVFCALASFGRAQEKPDAQKLPFTPPPLTAMPGGAFGDAVKHGENIFRHTTIYASGAIGNKLNCSNCHLGGGTLANSGPLWAAYTAYPAYRAKNEEVNDYVMRLQDCFRFSENGKILPADSPIIVAVEAYSYWLATGAPTGAALAGRGYPKLPAPPAPPDYARGAAVFKAQCALCHGADGAGQYTRGETVFPALWGKASYNWGAGMSNLNVLAAFAKANMPLGGVGMLSVQQAWDVAQYIDSHERPQDPRFTGSTAETRKKFHDTKFSMYGATVNGIVLGAPRQ
jgi:thiosulfate dehydrogenase